MQVELLMFSAVEEISNVPMKQFINPAITTSIYHPPSSFYFLIFTFKFLIDKQNLPTFVIQQTILHHESAQSL